MYTTVSRKYFPEQAMEMRKLLSNDTVSMEEVEKFFKEKQLWQFEFIFSFYHRPQKFLRCFTKITNNEWELLPEMFKLLKKTELQDLFKISTCMEIGDLPEFLKSIHGKFYFNPEINHDESTLKSKRLLMQYEEKLQYTEKELQGIFEEDEEDEYDSDDKSDKDKDTKINAEKDKKGNKDEQQKAN